MDEVLKTIFLRHEKSGLHVSLMRHVTGIKYVRIQQTKSDKDQEVHEVNIHPALLDELVISWNNIEALFPKERVGTGFCMEKKWKN